MTQKIPPQHEGASSDTQAGKAFESLKEADAFFEIVKNRLLNVNEWKHFAGVLSAEFSLHDQDGNEKMGPASKNDYLCINIPGPGLLKGDGKDWVQIIEIKETNEARDKSIIMQVKPASNPNINSQETTHFFSDEASSSFIVKQEGNHVSAEVHGRNEKPNVEADSIVDKIRNVVVAGAAVTAFSKIQWSLLVNGLLNTTDV